MERDYLLGKKISRPLHAILIDVCDRHNVSHQDLLSPRRFRNLVRARHEAWWLAYTQSEASYPAIGKFFNRDHTTIMFGIRRHAARIGVETPNVQRNH